MKKLKEFNFNDGLDGVVIAKSLKQAVKKIAKYYEIEPYLLLKDIKRGIKSEEYSDECWIVDEWHVPKKGEYKKSKVLGWES